MEGLSYDREIKYKRSENEYINSLFNISIGNVVPDIVYRNIIYKCIMYEIKVGACNFYENYENDNSNLHSKNTLFYFYFIIFEYVLFREIPEIIVKNELILILVAYLQKLYEDKYYPKISNYSIIKSRVNLCIEELFIKLNSLELKFDNITL